MSSSPYSGAPQEVTAVSIEGSALQHELILNFDSGIWEGRFTLPEGCYTYQVKETYGCEVTYYGENAGYWPPIELYLPTEAEITFNYDPKTHLISSTPYSGNPQEATAVSLIGSLQNELGCVNDDDDECDGPKLTFNSGTGNWEGNFTLPAGCYTYRVKESFGCETTYYGENGSVYWPDIGLYIPLDAEIFFSYDPQTHIITSSPYTGIPTDPSKVVLIGSLQDKLGCAPDIDGECESTALTYDSETGIWAGSFNLPAGCYDYWTQVTSACKETRYGVDGTKWGTSIELYVPSEGTVTFRYDPTTNVTTSTPYSGVPLEMTSVSLIGSLQEEIGCEYNYSEDCSSLELMFNSDSGLWENTFTLSAGCYIYQVQETFGCFNRVRYGENAKEWGNDIQLLVPSETEVTFRYDPETHIISTTPYFDISTANQCPETIFVDNTPGTCDAIVDYPSFVVTAYCGGEISSITQIEGLPSGSIFPLGTTTNTYELMKITGEMVTCSFDVVVNDTESPVISELNKDFEPLWPPNHKMVPVFLAYTAFDNCNIATAELTISSNEPPSGPGKGNQAQDWEIVDDHHVLLRAERDPKGTGREYYITIKATDDAGNLIEEVTTVRVPLNQGKGTEGTYPAEFGNDVYILYPTPVEHILNIKGPESVSERAYSIYDMLGVVKLKGKIHDGKIEVNTLQSGSYVLKIKTDKGIVSEKFIKQ